MTEGPLITADGRPLKDALSAAGARARRRAFYLVAPLLLFVVATFLLPIAQLLMQSVHNTAFYSWTDRDAGVEVPLMVELRDWFEEHPAGTPPDEAAYAALAAGLAHAREVRAIGQI